MEPFILGFIVGAWSVWLFWIDSLMWSKTTNPLEKEGVDDLGERIYVLRAK
jgi:hypothetical protein